MFKSDSFIILTNSLFLIKTAKIFSSILLIPTPRIIVSLFGRSRAPAVNESIVARFGERNRRFTSRVILVGGLVDKFIAFINGFIITTLC